MKPLQLLVIDSDPIFRLGLRVACEQNHQLRVIAEVATATEALQDLVASGNAVAGQLDTIVWDWEVDLQLDRSLQPTSELAIFQELQQRYPNIPVFLLTSHQDPSLLTLAKQVGVQGYCPKGTSVAELVQAISQVAGGGSYWTPLVTDETLETSSQMASPWDASASARSVTSAKPSLFRKSLASLCQSGLHQIDTTLAEVSLAWEKAKQVQTADLSAQLDWVFLSGRRRELMAARWLVGQLLSVGQEPEVADDAQILKPPPATVLKDSSLTVVKLPSMVRSTQEEADWQSALWVTLASKLESDLVNLTGVPLEIDIFRLSKKRELIETISQKLKAVLAELQVSQVQIEQLSDKRFAIVQDLWERSIAEFFGKYYTLRSPLEGGMFVNSSQDSSAFFLSPSASVVVEGQATIEVVSRLLQEVKIVRQAILNNIPMVSELFAHLLLQTPLVIDNKTCVGGSPEAMQRSQALLENLILQVANGVVQPLLNNFADVEEIKQKFYNQQLLSTREIERFRNDLSWKYRLATYWGEPQAMFESRFELLTLNERGIQKVSIYAPRNQELALLSGFPLVVTLVLEVRDAIAPRFRTTISWIGTGAVYVLTQVIGRGLGLIGRGILQGIGNSLQDNRWERKGDR